MDIYLKFHLSHDGTDVVNALGEGLTAPGHSDGSLRGVGEHLARHLRILIG